MWPEDLLKLLEGLARAFEDIITVTQGDHTTIDWSRAHDLHEEVEYIVSQVGSGSLYLVE